jgi:hypothetical protein
MGDLIVTQDDDLSGFDCVDVFDDCAGLADQEGSRPNIKATGRQRRGRQHVTPLKICLSNCLRMAPSASRNWLAVS